MKKKIDGFIIGLITMIILAWLIPQPAMYKGSLSLENITQYGIFLIFFFYGLKLSPHEMRKGLSNYRLHLLVQLSTFILFPLIVITFKPLAINTETQLIWLAVFFLAALPSTVSSSVVMVVLAKGNIPGAIFNASISGLLGILITPLWMGLFMNTADATFDLPDIITNLIIKILLPVIAGLLLHRHWGNFAKKNSKKLALFDKTIILLIVYKSFASSFSSGQLTSINWYHLAIIVTAVSSLLLIIYNLISYITHLSGFNRKDRITALFCGSKKSLVHGTVMLNVLFKGMTYQGLILLPIMLYHALQLIVISIIAQKMAKSGTE